MRKGEIRITSEDRLEMMRRQKETDLVDFLDLKDKHEQSTYFFGALIFLSYLLVILTFPLSLCFCLKVSETISFSLCENVNSMFCLSRLYKNTNGPLYFDWDES